MKLLFIHTGERVREDEKGNIYVDGAYSSEILQRYLEISNDFTVMFKKNKQKVDTKYALKNLEKLDTNNIKFIEYIDLNKSIKDFINIKKRISNKKIVKDAVNNADKIIVRLPCTAGYQAVKYALKDKKMFIIEVVGCIKDALINYGIIGKIFSIPKYLKMKKCVKKAPYVIYVTNEFLQKRYKNNYNNIGCSDVSIPKLNEAILQKRVDKIQRLENNKQISLATVGAVNVKYKGQEYVIKAIKKLKSKGFNIKYYIIGGGDQSYLLNIIKKQKLEENVIFTGALPHDKVFEYLDNIDIYIQPSKVEGLPRAVIEAMSRGCPIIVSNVGGNTELIKEKKFVFEKSNIGQLSKCIENMTIDNMIEQAKLNFEQAKNYEADILNAKRNDFYKLIKD